MILNKKIYIHTDTLLAIQIENECRIFKPQQTLGHRVELIF